MNTRVALVTGGAQGIGRGIVTSLAGAGFHVAIADLNLETAEKTAQEIRNDGGTAIAVHIDVTSSARQLPLPSPPSSSSWAPSTSSSTMPAGTTS